jgi:CRISPR-associated protein Cas6
VHIKGKKILGFGLTLKNLSPEDSMKILTHGLGGRRHMGCGIFSPVEK